MILELNIAAYFTLIYAIWRNGDITFFMFAFSKSLEGRMQLLFIPGQFGRYESNTTWKRVKLAPCYRRSSLPCLEADTLFYCSSSFYLAKSP